MSNRIQRRVRTSVVVIHRERILTFRAIDPDSGAEYFFLPGGKIESNETAPEAAEREVLEETGYRVWVDPSSCLDKEYQFKWNGEIFDCLTLFYRGELQDLTPASVDDAEYNKGVHWLPVSDVVNIFSYSAEILKAVQALVY